MFLTVSKRLEFSASRRLANREWSDAQNRAAFGDEATAKYGTGRNYVAWFVFTGDVDKATGMLMNISEIKRRAGEVINDRYDHRFLNEDNQSFVTTVPTPENVARQLATDVTPLFRDTGAQLTAVHLIESPARGATAYSNGKTEANFDFDFSAARRTASPNLTVAENRELFGVADSPHAHGHHYRARLTVSAETVNYEAMRALAHDLRGELDHRNLNEEVPGLRGQPTTTEVLTRYLYQRGEGMALLDRVRLHERDDFFAEYRRTGDFSLGMQYSFGAAHRLQSYESSEAENAAMYGKCNNPKGHGHLYIAEATIGGKLDERSGTLFSFTKFQDALRDAISPWENRHLDLETEEFKRVPSTGENIVQMLWPKVDAGVRGRMERLRLWETANNRFTLRRDL